MLRVKANLVVYLILVCFALLQVFSPFIHAHLDTEHFVQNTGFHMGDAHEEKAIDLTSTDSGFITVGAHASHTISVASGIKQEIDSTFMTGISLLVLFFLCFALNLTPALKQFFSLRLTPLQPLKRKLPASRAPPQF